MWPCPTGRHPPVAPPGPRAPKWQVWVCIQVSLCPCPRRPTPPLLYRRERPLDPGLWLCGVGWWEVGIRGRKAGGQEGGRGGRKRCQAAGGHAPAATPHGGLRPGQGQTHLGAPP